MKIHEVVVVGAGLAGASTAWHLAQRGIDDVLLFEREATPGVHSSGRNASMVRERVRDATWQPLATEGAAFLREGRFAEFKRTGSLLLGLGDENAAAHVPIARGSGLWCPDDGLVDVAALLAGYLYGRDVRYGTSVRGWSRAGDHLVVQTSAGEIGARTLVNAAGPWAGEVGGIPMTPLNRHVFVTEPMPDVDPAWPFVWDVDAGFYFRPESGGLLLSPCDETSAPPGAYVQDEAQLERLAWLVETRQPALGDLKIAYRWVGQRTFAADRAPVIGRDPAEARLVHVAGLGGHGVTGSFAVGRVAADAVLGEAVPESVDPARLAR